MKTLIDIDYLIIKNRYNHAVENAIKINSPLFADTIT